MRISGQHTKNLYRYYDVQFSAGCDESGNDLGPGRVGVYLQEFPVVKETKCGAWILTAYCFGDVEVSVKDCKFVNLKANKKFACLTLEEAKESFIARKKRQVRLLKAQIIRAEKALLEIEKETSWMVKKQPDTFQIC